MNIKYEQLIEILGSICWLIYFGQFSLAIIGWTLRCWSNIKIISWICFVKFQDKIYFIQIVIVFPILEEIYAGAGITTVVKNCVLQEQRVTSFFWLKCTFIVCTRTCTYKNTPCLFLTSCHWIHSVVWIG